MYGKQKGCRQGFGGKFWGNRPPGRPKLKWEDNIKKGLQEVGCWPVLDSSDVIYRNSTFLPHFARAIAVGYTLSTTAGKAYAISAQGHDKRDSVLSAAKYVSHHSKYRHLKQRKDQ